MPVLEEAVGVRVRDHAASVLPRPLGCPAAPRRLFELDEFGPPLGGGLEVEGLEPPDSKRSKQACISVLQFCRHLKSPAAQFPMQNDTSPLHFSKALPAMPLDCVAAEDLGEMKREPSLGAGAAEADAEEDVLERSQQASLSR